LQTFSRHWRRVRIILLARFEAYEGGTIMEDTTTSPHVYPAENAWDEEETADRPRPGYSRVSQTASDWLVPDADEANSDLGNSGRDVTDPSVVGRAA
jgi:hypothetical protein